MNKREALEALARKRQEAVWVGYKNVGDFHDGKYDCLHVCPYTKSAANFDAEIMVMLQDWASEKFLRGEFDVHVQQHGHCEWLPTNRNLKRLLQEHLGAPLDEVYGTDLFPFIKPGDMGQRIPRRDLVRAAKEFALPQVRIVQPKLVICLGLQTYNGMREACDQRRVLRLPEAISGPFTFEGARVWCQAHTGGRGQAMRGPKVADDWRRMKEDAGFSAARGPGSDLDCKAA